MLPASVALIADGTIAAHVHVEWESCAVDGMDVSGWFRPARLSVREEIWWRFTGK